MQQVEHGIAFVVVVVARRSIDVHAALGIQRGGAIPNLAYFAVRNILVVFKVGLFAGNEDHAVHAGEARFDNGVPGVRGLHAIHVIAIAVEVGCDRTNCRRPDALVVLGHFRFRSEIAADNHFGCLGGGESKRQPMIVVNLRRGQSLPRSARPLSRRLRGRRQHKQTDDHRQHQPQSSHDVSPFDMPSFTQRKRQNARKCRLFCAFGEVKQKRKVRSLHPKRR